MRYDLGEGMEEEPKKAQRMLKGVAEDMERGALKTINERVYPLKKAKEAYQYMFEGKHVGKIVFEQASCRSTGEHGKSGCMHRWTRS